jgi:hypothetical protein
MHSHRHWLALVQRWDGDCFAYHRLVDGVPDPLVEREFRLAHGHAEAQVLIRNDDAYRRTVLYQLVVDGRNIRPQYCRMTYTVRLD